MSKLSISSEAKTAAQQQESDREADEESHPVLLSAKDRFNFVQRIGAMNIPSDYSNPQYTGYKNHPWWRVGNEAQHRP